MMKKYRCSQCGHIKRIDTNHYLSCWSWGKVNCCPKCPPFRKYPEFGGQTIWDCLEKPEEKLRMTKENFRVVALALKASRPVDDTGARMAQWEFTVRNLVVFFADASPEFQKEQFLQTCGFYVD